MLRMTQSGLSLLVVFSLALIAGCRDPQPAALPEKAPSKAGSHEHDEHAHGEHGHGEHGPHGGHLVELGSYHAEVVHDDASGAVTIYILDGKAKENVAIEAAEVVVNLKHDGKGSQFKLPAEPQDGDGEGKSSRFVSAAAELGKLLDEHDTQARLVLEIDGKSYTGKIEHDHDHEHDHVH